MPVLDGWGVARMLAERGIRVPPLVITAARDGASWASEIGADSYLAKPFAIGDLLEAVRRGVDHPPLAAN
jgi:CheY-like chemotaxis protein